MTARRSFLIGATLVAGSAAALAPAPAGAQSADVMKLRDELMELEKASWGFMRDKNYDGMRNFLGEDALLIFGDGTRYNKRQTLELMKDFALQYLTIE